jgi:hypothetical protein
MDTHHQRLKKGFNMENQKGKWSDWFSNVGNTDRYRPLNYKGDLDVFCDVIFREIPLQPPSQIEFLDWAEDGGGTIISYRYWIPEEDTSWTEEDQKELERLEQKRKVVTEAQNNALREVFQSIERNSLYTIDSRIDSAKRHAKQLIEALKPFVKD